MTTQTAGAVVIVTGATRGIGRAIALRCAADRARLVLVARDTQALESTAAACIKAGAESAMAYPLDLERCEAIPSLFNEVSRRFGQLDGLVNNAGILHEGLLGMIRPSDIDRVLAINVKAPLMALQLAARLMSRKRRGSIVNVVSIMATMGSPGLSLYAASKSALIGATLCASKELAPRGIRVNAVSPGFIDTEMTQGLPEAAHASRLAAIGLGRAGTPEEVANVVAFLLGEQSSYISGQILGVDGRMVV